MYCMDCGSGLRLMEGGGSMHDMDCPQCHPEAFMSDSEREEHKRQRSLDNLQITRITRLQCALQRIMYATSLEDAQELAKVYLDEDHQARRRKDDGNYTHPCYD